MIDLPNGEAASAAEFVNEFALVAYVPDPLGSYLDETRKSLAPWMQPGRSHLTLLQPRPLLRDPIEVWSDLRGAAAVRSAVEIEATTIEVFPETGVVYVDIGRGTSELRRMHESLNANGAFFSEPYPFHPHITLAQGVEPKNLGPVRERAAEIWSEYTDERQFLIDRLYFVQNTMVNLWMDLYWVDLPSADASRRFV